MELQGAGRPPPSLCERRDRNIVDATSRPKFAPSRRPRRTFYVCRSGWRHPPLSGTARNFIPESVEEIDACRIVRDANGQALAYV